MASLQPLLGLADGAIPRVADAARAAGPGGHQQRERAGARVGAASHRLDQLRAVGGLVSHDQDTARTRCAHARPPGLVHWSFRQQRRSAARLLPGAPPAGASPDLYARFAAELGDRSSHGGGRSGVAPRQAGRVPGDDPAHPGDACPSPDGPRIPARPAPSSGRGPPCLGCAGAPPGRAPRPDRDRPARLRRVARRWRARSRRRGRWRRRWRSIWRRSASSVPTSPATRWGGWVALELGVMGARAASAGSRPPACGPSRWSPRRRSPTAWPGGCCPRPAGPSRRGPAARCCCPVRSPTRAACPRAPPAQLVEAYAPGPRLRPRQRRHARGPFRGPGADPLPRDARLARPRPPHPPPGLGP